MRIDPYDLPYLGSCPLPFEIVTAILKYNLAYDTPSFAYRTFNEDDEESMEMAVLDSTRGNLLSKTSYVCYTPLALKHHIQDPQRATNQWIEAD
jgi:hypothetical protein